MKLDTYALKVSDIVALTEKVNAIWDNPDYAGFTDKKKIERIDKLERKKYDTVGDDLVRGFLEMYSGFGVDIYQADDDNLDSWKKLVLNNTSPPNINKEACNE